MSPQIENLVQFLSKLPQPQQNKMAESLLEEAKWEASLESPKAKAVLDKMLERVREEIEEGTTMPLEEFLIEADKYDKENR